MREIEYPTFINLGQWYQPYAMNQNIKGWLRAPVPLFWNVEKKEGKG